MPKAPTRKKSPKLESSASVIPLGNLDRPDALTPMNFRVSAQFHREFKLYAVQHGMSMVDLLQASFKVLKEKRAL
jgi:hypothetical protein